METYQSFALIVFTSHELGDLDLETICLNSGSSIRENEIHSTQNLQTLQSRRPQSMPQVCKSNPPAKSAHQALLSQIRIQTFHHHK